MKRRDFLVASMAAFLSPVAPRTVLGEDSTNELKARFKNLFVVMVPGGWDVTYLFEPKPDSSKVKSPLGDVETIGALDLWCSDARPAARSFFEEYGSISAVINGNAPTSSSRCIRVLRSSIGVE